MEDNKENDIKKDLIIHELKIQIEYLNQVIDDLKAQNKRFSKNN